MNIHHEYKEYLVEFECVIHICINQFHCKSFYTDLFIFKK